VLIGTYLFAGQLSVLENVDLKSLFVTLVVRIHTRDDLWFGRLCHTDMWLNLLI
jgi:hypothetical protein